MRSCSNGVFKRSGQIGRPCLLGYIEKCSAPCVGNISAEDHRAIVDDFCDFIAGDNRPRGGPSERLQTSLVIWGGAPQTRSAGPPARRCPPPPRRSTSSARPAC